MTAKADELQRRRERLDIFQQQLAYPPKDHSAWHLTFNTLQQAFALLDDAIDELRRLREAEPVVVAWRWRRKVPGGGAIWSTWRDMNDGSTAVPLETVQGGPNEIQYAYTSPQETPAGWRPISTALPPDHQYVLCALIDGGQTIGRVYPQDGTRWWVNRDRKIIYPTHWMPLPQPPVPEDAPPKEKP